MSPIAYKLFAHLQSQPAGQNVVMEDLVGTLRSSKTAIRAALYELETEGLVSVTQEA